MDLKIEELLNRSEFQKLGKERIEAFKKLAADLNGKKGAEALSILVQFQKDMPKEPAISKAEQAAMKDILFGTLSAEDKEKYQFILKYFGQN